MLGPACCLVGPRPYQARPWLRHCFGGGSNLVMSIEISQSAACHSTYINYALISCIISRSLLTTFTDKATTAIHSVA